MKRNQDIAETKLPESRSPNKKQYDPLPFRTLLFLDESQSQARMAELMRVPPPVFLKQKRKKSWMFFRHPFDLLFRIKMETVCPVKTCMTSWCSLAA
jgi:hypothetical protein